jgi:hypothetical protein
MYGVEIQMASERLTLTRVLLPSAAELSDPNERRTYGLNPSAYLERETHSQIQLITLPGKRGHD